MAVERYRLMTRGSFDGLVCAVLLKQLDQVESILNRTSAADIVDELAGHLNATNPATV
jgi:hypothetical protein